jgi:hypothetical protein
VQRGLDLLQRGDQRARQRLVARRVHVQRAVRLDVLQPQAREPRELAQRAQLVDHVVDQLVGRRVDVAAAEPHEVAKARMGADAHAMFARQVHHPAHDVRVAGVEAGRDVGRADQGHQLFVDAVADGPGAEAFAHVGVQIDQRFLHGVAAF